MKMRLIYRNHDLKYNMKDRYYNNNNFKIILKNRDYFVKREDNNKNKHFKDS